MAGVTLELDEELVEVLREQDPGRPVEDVARELIVLELYRRRAISGGLAARFLGMGRFDFIGYSGDLGIPFIDMTEEEWQAELRAIEETVRSHPLSRTPAR